MRERPWPTLWPYTLPPDLIRAHSSPSGQNTLQEVLHESIDASVHRAASADAADFFYVPVPFHWAGRGRSAAAAILSFIRASEPHFNRSVSRGIANHLLTFTGDLGPDLPPRRTFRDGLPAEIDLASPSRLFIALSLTGNPETGFQKGKDIVLPPTHNLKGGPLPTERCCKSGARATKHCKPTPHALEESPWSNRTLYGGRLISWAGQASGGGMGRHGGSGPAARAWLTRSLSKVFGPSLHLITDTNSKLDRARNAHLLPASMLWSTRPDHPRYGFLLPSADPQAAFCAAPYGRGNGWEGRSASALRAGAYLYQSIHRLGDSREPFIPWERFSSSGADRKTLFWRLAALARHRPPSSRRSCNS